MSNNLFYVYMYIDPETNLPFYIGKGKGARLFKHLHETYKNTENKKKYAVIKNLRTKGLEPIIKKVEKDLSEEDAYKLEETLIKKYGRRDIDVNGILTNICASNRPPDMSGILWTEDRKAALSASRKGNANPMYGKTLSTEHKKKISESLTGENNGFYGKTHSKKTRQLMSEKASNREIHGMEGKHHSTESKIKIQLNNPQRKSIHTPYGIFNSAEEFAKLHNTITANGLRNWLKQPDKVVTLASVSKAKYILLKEHIGKTFREIGFYYVND